MYGNTHAHTVCNNTLNVMSINGCLMQRVKSSLGKIVSRRVRHVKRSEQSKARKIFHLVITSIITMFASRFLSFSKVR